MTDLTTVVVVHVDVQASEPRAWDSSVGLDLSCMSDRGRDISPSSRFVEERHGGDETVVVVDGV